jgi:hypothetical protein
MRHHRRVGAIDQKKKSDYGSGDGSTQEGMIKTSLSESAWQSAHLADTSGRIGLRLGWSRQRRGDDRACASRLH